MKLNKVSVLLVATSLILLTACAKKDNNRYTGTLESDDYYITSQVSGKIEHLKIQQGDEVGRNQIAAKIESKQYKLQKMQAEGAYDTAKANYDELPDGVSDNKKKQLKGAIKQAKAQVNLAQLSINECSISVPNKGIVSEVFFHTGELVQSGNNIARVIIPDNSYIKVYVEQSKRNLIKLKDKLKLYYDNKKVGIGTVNYISSEAEFTPKNTETKSDKENTVFEVKISTPAGFNYSPGTLIDVEIK
ncbi:efflux RND transporter periplasmic adaptor subunit [Clostridium oryzae]|uniref:p-hydroxybenzoic acid efflux pump subunit AaeA n=1 Tax=Clostridium oryzae TaxID=1450648 RepID=A0A1V4I6Z3_9CLOT|nr:HlyD family efflux transporter periplasmic adaptor subunit [Clostridium oryzae]OPJ55752.1 p-hydroxybenzoic acid efflux pump subunit AaeA [Clostridium oryzae]